MALYSLAQKSLSDLVSRAGFLLTSAKPLKGRNRAAVDQRKIYSFLQEAVKSSPARFTEIQVIFDAEVTRDKVGEALQTLMQRLLVEVYLG